MSLARDNYFFRPNYSMSTIAECSDRIGIDKDNALFRDFIQTDCSNSYVIVLAIYFDPINKFALSIQPFKKIIFTEFNFTLKSQQSQAKELSQIS